MVIKAIGGYVENLQERSQHLRYRDCRSVSYLPRYLPNAITLHGMQSLSRVSYSYLSNPDPDF